MPNTGDHLIKRSTKRLVISGSTFELYEYERCYFYNRPPDKRTAGSAKPKSSANGRRDDNLIAARTQIRRLVLANERAWGQRLKFITFTFARNQCDLDGAMKMWDDYMKRMRRAYGPMKYLAVVEFQKRGAVHFHVLFFNLPFIYGVKDDLAEMWGHGFVKVITVNHVKNLGAYVSKYLRKEIMDKRLLGRKAFFCSRGLIQPLEFRAEDRIDKVLAGYTLEEEVQREYPSKHFGRITYCQGQLT